MPMGAMLFLGAIFLVFLGLDVFMLVTLQKPGDERGQIIVWKASAFTLLGVSGANAIEVVADILQSQPVDTNPFVMLETTAIIYFVTLLYYKWRHGG